MKRHVTQSLEEIRERIEAAPALAVFLDFDGTLAPLADHPSQVSLEDDARQRLSALLSCPDVTLAIVSGRELVDLEECINLAGVIYAGNHGLEISGPECAFVEPNVLEHRPVLKELTEDLARRLREIPGAWVENKCLTASVHFRNVAPANEEAVRRLVHGSLANTSHPFLLTSGDKIFDIRPRVYWNKGHAVNWIREKAAGPNALALYIGDDLTDEDAFAALPDDITIKVGGSPETSAQFYLENTEEVQEFLGWLADEHITAHLLCDGR